jgi:hypothetical protein
MATNSAEDLKVAAKDFIDFPSRIVETQTPSARSPSKFLPFLDQTSTLKLQFPLFRLHSPMFKLHPPPHIQFNAFKSDKRSENFSLLQLKVNKRSIDDI